MRIVRGVMFKEYGFGKKTSNEKYHRSDSIVLSLYFEIAPFEQKTYVFFDVNLDIMEKSMPEHFPELYEWT